MANLIQKKRILAFFKSPQTLVIVGFAGLILVGALLLVLPWSHAPGKVGFVDALFTSTSAVCVTGLVVVDTATDYTFFGQLVIMLLIQAGGLGVMTFAALAFQTLGRRLSLQSQAVLHDTFFQRDVAGEFQRTFKSILAVTFAIEGTGALLLFLFALSAVEPDRAVFCAIFHSISAFCNAGFSTFSENLMALKSDTGFLTVIMTLIVLGGIGYTVLNELWVSSRRAARRELGLRPRRFSLHARLVMTITAILIVGGGLFLLICGLTPDETSPLEKLVHAMFQSVTARTAGFNSIDIGRMPSASLFILILLMFVGGSPGSCAGGVKTTTLGIWWARFMAGLRERRDVRLLDRGLPEELTRRSDVIVALAVLWNIAGILFLLTTQSDIRVQALDLIFEQVSAFGTVGLSTGVTPKLTVAGKLWIIATMFVGRLGPLTIAMWMIPPDTVHVRHPKGTVMIG